MNFFSLTIPDIITYPNIHLYSRITLYSNFCTEKRYSLLYLKHPRWFNPQIYN